MTVHLAAFIRGRFWQVVVLARFCRCANRQVRGLGASMAPGFTRWFMAFTRGSEPSSVAQDRDDDVCVPVADRQVVADQRYSQRRRHWR